MPAKLFEKNVTRWRFRTFILLLQIPVMTLFAAEERLQSSPLPAGMAHGNFTALGRVPGTNALRLALELPVRNAAALTNLLAAIYNPASPQYHHYLAPGEFAARFGPTPADYAAVIGFARTNGLRVVGTHPNRLVVDVAGRVADVERAFHVKLYSYRQPAEARNFFAPDTRPTVDARLPLLQVGGLNTFSRPHPNVVFSPAAPGRRPGPNGGSSPQGTFMGNDFRQAYVPGTALTGAGQNVGLVEFDGFYADDIARYADTIGLTNDVPQVVTVQVDGGVEYPGAGSVEVALDIEMVMAMAPGVSNIYVYEAPGANVFPWVDILCQMADDDAAAQLSCSWSGGDPDPAAEQIFLQMAAQGQTFFNATGDSGAFYDVVEFPSASPNITEVGGSYLLTDTNGDYLGEAVWNRGGGIGGSGGACPGVAMPAWQLGVDMTTNGGSTVCRNVPDVALTADDVYVIADGQAGLAGGTSCAAPLWAGLAALINEQAAQLGQPPVGFLNPALYALCRGTNYAACFHDIITGNNTNLVSTTNYEAVSGFDLGTGWGTPAGTNLINALTTPDALGVLPPAMVSTCNVIGAPFSGTNWILTLTNAGPACLDWALGGVPDWLAVSAGSGVLAANGSTNLVLQLRQPGALPAGSYDAVIGVTNLGLSRVQNVPVRIDVEPSIVQNGGFETGDFTGWTLVGDTVIGPTICNVVATEQDHPGVAHSGYFGALLAESGQAATLTQTLATTPGQQYLVSCWLNNPAAYDGQFFSASWDTNFLVEVTNPPAFTWSNLQYVVTATGTNATLRFAAENDDSFFGLDDVSVTPVPPVMFTGWAAVTNGFQCSWPSLAGLNYRVQYRDNLPGRRWRNLEFVAAGTNVATYTDTNVRGAAGQRFYRLVLLP